MTKRKRRAWVGAVAVVIVLAALVVGCGGDSGPTTVSAADLRKDGEFWLSLDAPLRRELARICHDRQVKTAPADLVLSLQEIDVDDYVALINREYEEQGSASASDIEEACDEAQQELAREEFEQLAPHLGRGE